MRKKKRSQKFHFILYLIAFKVYYINIVAFTAAAWVLQQPREFYSSRVSFTAAAWFREATSKDKLNFLGKPH